jgi:hypothetical protein
MDAAYYRCTGRINCRCRECRSAAPAPSPEKIAAECERIRSRWTEREFCSRIVCDVARQAAARGWVVPVIDLDRPEEAVDALWRE